MGAIRQEVAGNTDQAYIPTHLRILEAVHSQVEVAVARIRLAKAVENCCTQYTPDGRVAEACPTV